jgi:hypothetical protein
LKERIKAGDLFQQDRFAFGEREQSWEMRLEEWWRMSYASV